MSHDFCTRLMAKIRHLGYAPHDAGVLLWFLVRCMTAVCALMGVLNVPERALWDCTVTGNMHAAEPEPVTHCILPAAPGIHHLSPA
ncbi:MAG: hypothetical protein WC362_09150 [Methanoregula sp.]